MQDRKPARRVLAVAALLTGLGMAALPTTGMAILMPWLMQQGAFPASTAALIQAGHTYGLVLGALPMAALAARLGPRRGFLAALLALAGLVPAASLPLDLPRAAPGPVPCGGRELRGNPVRPRGGSGAGRGPALPVRRGDRAAQRTPFPGAGLNPVNQARCGLRPPPRSRRSPPATPPRPWPKPRPPRRACGRGRRPWPRP